MQTAHPRNLSRRAFLRRLSLFIPIPWILAACERPSVGIATPTEADQSTTSPDALSSNAPSATASSSTEPSSSIAPTPAEAAPTQAAQVLLPTPACPDADELTPAQTEGPYFTPNSPERKSLVEADTQGTPLLVSGYVLSTHCQPLPGALLDFWHCNDKGAYDNVGFKLRGHQFTDAQGRYALETIVPAIYPGRTRHIHVKVQAPGGPILTTQLYFPGEPQNATDGIFQPELLMTMGIAEGRKSGAFDFVLTSAA